MDNRKVKMPSGGLQGEGNYDAAREYNDRTRQFVKSGRVEVAAREAAPKTEEEAAALKHAEDIGRRRAGRVGNRGRRRRSQYGPMLKRDKHPA